MLDEDGLDSYLTEYQTLRSEILQRMQIRDQVLLFSLGAVGVLFGLAIQFNRTIFLLCPLMLFPLAKYWTYADIGIAKVANHIRTVLEPKLRLSWETRMAGERRQRRSEWNFLHEHPNRTFLDFAKLWKLVFGKRRSEFIASTTFIGSSMVAIVLYLSLDDNKNSVDIKVEADGPIPNITVSQNAISIQTSTKDKQPFIDDNGNLGLSIWSLLTLDTLAMVATGIEIRRRRRIEKHNDAI